MKNISFNRKQSLLRNLDEVAAPKKKINWDKVVYFIVLGFIVFFVFRYFITKTFYVEANGHVLFKSLKIRVPDDITIKKFFVSEGDTLHQGDTVFIYTSYKDELAASNAMAMGEMNITSVKNTSSSWHEKEQYQLRKQISLNNIAIAENTELITWYETQIAELKNQVILEITPQSKIEQYKKEIEKLNLANAALTKENVVFNNLITNLNSMHLEHQAQVSTNDPAINLSNGGIVKPQLRYYISPLDGIVTRMYKENFEVALKSEDIMHVHKKEDIYIKAYFEQDDLNHFKQGDEVKITFPDGSVSYGNIKRFYFATYRLPEEFQKKYESTTRAIAADIFPIKNEQEIKWKAYYKMNVNISISKF